MEGRQTNAAAYVATTLASRGQSTLSEEDLQFELVLGTSYCPSVPARSRSV